MEEFDYKNGGKELFRQQIEDDIKLIQKDYSKSDSRLNQPSYAFNYWILSRLYSMDEDTLEDYVTDYSDKGIDCYAYFPDTKELYLIQNKYYDESTQVARKEVADFLTTPLTVLLEGKYTKSKDLQKIFNEIYEDESAKIWLHFYVTNDKKTDAIVDLVSRSKFKDSRIKANVMQRFYTLEDIYNFYFEDRFKGKKNFEGSLTTRVQATSLSVRPENYNLDWMIKSRFVMVNVVDLYDLYKKAKEEEYQLFEENVREFLGSNVINNGIINTLKDVKERENFFYYNNGITMICKELEEFTVKPASRQGGIKHNQLGFKLYNPQIVNGCQTINSICEVLSGCRDEDIYKDYEKTYVLVKIYVFDEKTKDEKGDLDKRIVKFTNSQNGIDDKAFAAKKSYFNNLQKDLKGKGFLLLVKPSDKNMLSNEHKNKKKKEREEFLEKGKEVLQLFKIGDYQSLKNHMIPLEKLLKVLLAFEHGGHAAFTKGSSVLKLNSEIYKNFSLEVFKKFRQDNIINLYYLFLKADDAKKASNDGKTPIPYYVIGFLGYLFKDMDYTEKNDKLEQLFSDEKLLNEVYEFYVNLIFLYVRQYSMKHKKEYNLMIKQEIDYAILNWALETEYNDTRLSEHAKKFLME